MGYYYTFLAIVMVLASIYDRNTKNKLVYLAILLVMVLFAGLRSMEVGTDSMGYVGRFLMDDTIVNSDKTESEQLKDEGGYYLLNLILGKISNQYWVLFTGIALLTYCFVLHAIRTQTNKLLIPLFVYITLGLYTFVFNAARQGIAVGIYMVSFQYLFKNLKFGFPRYCLLVLLAATFHKTAIIAIPLYFLFRNKYSVRILILNAIVGLLIGVSLPILFAFSGELNARYLIYQSDGQGGEMLTLFYIIITAFFIFWRRHIDPDRKIKYDIFLNMMIFGTLIYIVVQISGVYIEMTRFAAYFQVAAVFLWTFIFQSKRKPAPVISAAIIIGHLIYFTLYCTKMGNLIPYSINPEIF